MYSKIKSPVKTSALSLKGKSKFKSVQTSQRSRKFHICVKGKCKMEHLVEENANNIKDYFHILIIHIKVW